MKLSQLLKGLDIISTFRRCYREKSPLFVIRRINVEEGSLFVAIPGLKHDGHDFIAEAISPRCKLYCT